MESTIGQAKPEVAGRVRSRYQRAGAAAVGLSTSAWCNDYSGHRYPELLESRNDSILAAAQAVLHQHSRHLISVENVDS